jgi:hypothetical protein
LTILQEIYTWSKNLPLWQQDAIRRLYIDRTLSDTDLEDLYAMAKSAHGIVDPIDSAPRNLNFRDAPSCWCDASNRHEIAVARSAA